MFRLSLITFLIGVAVATEVRTCKSGPSPTAVRIKGCDKLPCDVVQGTNVQMEIDFNAGNNDAEELKTKVRATALGITVPYPLPDKIANVCSNLLNGQECPLDSGEDATYLFDFPIGKYPEIGVAVEILIKNQDNEVVTCCIVDIKVKKGTQFKTVFREDETDDNLLVQAIYTAASVGISHMADGDIKPYLTNIFPNKTPIFLNCFLKNKFWK